MSEELQDCNPQIEECPVPSNLSIVEGDLNSTLIIGFVALFQAILPLLLRFNAASTTISDSSSSIYQFAWSGWWIGNMFIWGFLTFLWPLTYMQIHVIYSFYLQYYQIMGIYGGVALTGIVGAMFLYSVLAQSADATYAVLYLLVNPILIAISYLYYETAHAYYIPQTRIARKEVVDDDDDG